MEIKSTFTWYPKWTQTGLRSQTALKCRAVYTAIYMEISLWQLSKHQQNSIAHVQIASLINANLINAKKFYQL